MAKKKKKDKVNIIAKNKRATFDYFIEDRHQAGLELRGWEVKSLREGKGQITESYVTIKNGEMFLFGAHIAPLTSASTHVNTDPARTRKLLLHKDEIDKLIGLVERKGYTLVPINLHWKESKEKQRDWQRDKARILKN